MSDQPHSVSTPISAEKLRQRDAETHIAIGLYILVLGIAVAVGTIWAMDKPHAAIVNFICGVVLIVVGVGFIAYGGVLWRRHKRGL